ncbi:MAG: dihydroorotate dehydrogenase [Sphaerochaetaceae bacterium]|nr:dihydroorotate dehydrogenase [Sphaerochaetaceae bacterium]
MLDRISHNHLKNKVMLCTVSGVASTKSELINFFDKEIKAIDIITTKSYQVNENPGNREPIICEMENGSFGNSVGLRNPGMLKGIEDLKKLKDLKAFLNISLSASSIEDFVILIKNFSPFASMIELNFSCPHASVGYGSSIGSSGKIAGEYVKGIKKAIKGINTPIFVKLTPNVDNIGEIAKKVIEEGADGIVAINTVGPEIHINQESGKPILNNNLGGKGGKSGRWVHLKALKAIREIRESIGDDVPIIGMGGVFSGHEVAAMIRAGADVVGMGSVLAKVDQRDWADFLDSVKNEGKTLLEGKSLANIKPSSFFLKEGISTSYTSHTILEKRMHDKDTAILVLSGTMNCKAGEFAFLWHPDFGEKPFSVAKNNPLTFIIKRRGMFTDALLELQEKDIVYSRGLYGSEVKNEKTPKAILIAGGTGEAVLTLLAEKLKKEGTTMSFFVGTTSSKGGILSEDLKKFGPYLAVIDDGKPGRVLDSINIENKDLSNTAVYIVGPEIFLKKAAIKLSKQGIKESRIYISMEKNSMCGIGLCGECACGSRLTCQWGTFMTYEYLLEENVL